MIKIGDRVKFKTHLQHGEGIVREVFKNAVAIVTTEVFNNLNDTRMVAGYSKMLYFSQIEKVKEESLL